MAEVLILLRHGQTFSNVDRKLDTQLPGAALTPLGEEQAREVGEELCSLYDVTCVISSQALRARQTAQRAFGEKFAEIPAVEGLHEVNAGRWEMQNSREAHEHYFRAFRGFYQRDPRAEIEGGDSLERFMGRYTAGLLPYLQGGGSAAGGDTGEDTVGDTVAVSHGGAIRAFAANAAHLTGVTAGYAERSHLANCQYIVLDPGDPVGELGTWRVVKWAGYPLP